MLTDEQIAELRRLEKAATRGPWHVCIGNPEYFEEVDAGHATQVCGTDESGEPDGPTIFDVPLDRIDETGDGERDANAALTVALRNAAPALLDAAADAVRLREALAGLRRNSHDGVTKIDCWCDSERGTIGGMPTIGHAAYCKAACAALRPAQGGA